MPTNPQNQEVLGDSLYVSIYVLRAAPSRARLETLLKKVVRAVGMSTAGLPAKAWVYPLESGQGGVGVTICQPLVESFIIADSWPELSKTYLVLASCRRYSPQAVAAVVAQEGFPCEFQGWLTAR